MVVIGGLFFHYDIHTLTLYMYPLQYLIWDRREENKYLVRVEDVYEVKPRFQEDWRHRLRHVQHVSLNIGCICVGKQRCTQSRLKEHYSKE